MGGCGFEPLPIKDRFYRPAARTTGFNLPEFNTKVSRIEIRIVKENNLNVRPNSGDAFHRPASGVIITMVMIGLVHMFIYTHLRMVCQVKISIIEIVIQGMIYEISHHLCFHFRDVIFGS